ncbi:transmembrane protein 35B isoform X3 [Monodelphis domestica]|uniref:transmembrane protein 35B isoform X3 n=1 Tax=Monodelphis domestica TaxID=13616 RepID=UPI0024E26003|nr:transmembrane protein 35B isoform X3 [Monodelphis domestica]
MRNEFSMSLEPLGICRSHSSSRASWLLPPLSLLGTARQQFGSWSLKKVQHEHLTSLFPEHFLGYKLSPANLLILVGWMELTGGFLLALGNPLLQGLSNIVLIFLMMGIFYSLLISKESLIAYAPVTLCLGLLLLLNTRFCYR